MDFESTAVRAIIALILVVGLIGVVFWLVRRFGGERMGNAAARGRQPRLAVIDAATVDGRRRLVLIRRDNVEHLLMIGGPTDVVVEPNIVRAAGPPREAAPARPPAATDTLPRAVPLGEGTMWPLQPEPAPRAEPAPRIEPAARIEPPPRPEPAPRPQRPPAPPPMAEEPAQWAEPEPAPPPPPPAPTRERRPRVNDPLAGLAEELARAPAPPEAGPVEQPLRQAPRREPRAAPRPQPAAPPPPAPAPAAEPEFSTSADQNLAEMAQRLEAALRRPVKGDDARTAQPAPRGAPAPTATDDEEFAAPPPPPARPAPSSDTARPARPETRAPRADAKPAPQKSLYDSLEQEMASLLGRPNKP
jgi:flagellar protein FliO/FliZ